MRKKRSFSSIISIAVAKYFVLCALLLSFFSCISKEKKVRILRVSAAASLKEALEESVIVFSRKEKGVEVLLQFAASGVLAKQIEQGAPVDIFISASPVFMDFLETEKKLKANTRKTLASNRMVLIVSKEEFLPKEDLSRLLLSPKIHRIALGDPDLVPAGFYAKRFLQNLSLFDTLKEKFVFGAHVRQVLDWVVRQEADAGFVYQTDLQGRKDLQNKWVLLDTLEAPNIEYSIALLTNTTSSLHSQAFFDFMTGPAGREILQKHGFLPLDT